MRQKTHLKLGDRQTIEQMLNDKKNYSAIAAFLGKSVSCISKEIKSHIFKVRSGSRTQNYNNCKNRFSCRLSHLCIPCNAPRKQSLCKRCNICNKVCSSYLPDFCPKLSKPPYVCNACGNRYSCCLEKSFYYAAKAHEAYQEKLTAARTGISYSEDELKMLDDLISPLVRQGQSPHHIYATNRDSIMVSERTIYNLIGASLISARNLDLPRRVKYKLRKKKAYFKVDKSCRIGRDYDSFLKYMDDHPDTPVVQLDSVEGKKGGKVLLTIHFAKCEMMLAFLREANTAKSVIDVFNSLFDDLGAEEFRKVFVLCLADNGSEFSDPTAIEFDHDGSRRTMMFYCDPNAPYQKGSAERNHEFIRYFIPKGVDLGQYTQDDISLMMNHINSYARGSLGNKCPYEVFRFFYGEHLLNVLDCVTIPSQQVTLNKSIFKQEASQ